MGKNRDDEQMQALQAFIDQGVIEDVLGTVKSGKEATVYCCTARGSGALIAAKVYRARTVRGFSNDASYREGRLRRHNRYERAIAAKSRVGREFAFNAWVSSEFQTLTALRDAGADVPAPIAQSESVILMEYIGDEDAPAPMLANVQLNRDEAVRALERVLWNIELALACDRVHGDLSAFNVLYDEGRVVVIDFPQAVDARFNSNALPLLERDIERIVQHFERSGATADPRAIARSLWGRFLRAEL